MLMSDTRLSDCRKPPSRGSTTNSTASSTKTAVTVHLTSLRRRRRDRPLGLEPRIPSCWHVRRSPSCHAGPMPEDTSPDSRRARLWDAAASRGVPLLAILSTVAVVVVVYLAGKLIYKLRDIVLLMVVAGFIALLLNPVVVLLQRWKVRRRGFAVAIVTVFGLLVFAGLAFLFG